MAYTSDITIDTDVYSLVTQRATSSLRTDASRALDKPVSLNIAHETQNSGKVNSVVFIDSDETVLVDTIPTADSVRCQFKISYNTTLGRVGVEAELLRLRDSLVLFINDATNWDKFLNKES